MVLESYYDQFPVNQTSSSVKIHMFSSELHYFEIETHHNYNANLNFWFEWMKKWIFIGNYDISESLFCYEYSEKIKPK